MGLLSPARLQIVAGELPRFFEGIDECLTSVLEAKVALQKLKLARL